MAYTASSASSTFRAVMEILISAQLDVWRPPAKQKAVGPAPLSSGGSVNQPPPCGRQRNGAEP